MENVVASCRPSVGIDCSALRHVAVWGKLTLDIILDDVRSMISTGQVLMPADTLTCPTCGKTGTVAGNWVQPGVATGTTMTGLDPEHCEGCRETLEKNGYAIVRLNLNGDGTGTVEPEQ